MSKNGPFTKDLNWVNADDESTYVFAPHPEADIIQISDNDAEPIMTIKQSGEIIWHKPHEAGDAADIFCDHIKMSIENHAGIKQSRYEWEERILDAMKKHAETEPLTPEVLTEVFKKAIMVDKLKGIK